MAVRILQEQCRGCGGCLSACPWGLLHLSEKDELNARGSRYSVLADVDACRTCGRCATVCTAGVLSVPASEAAHALLDTDGFPPHAGCQLGTLASAIARVAEKEGLSEHLVLFKQSASEVGIHIETHDFDGPEFFEAALAFKREHPDRLVLIISPSAKKQSTEESIRRYQKLSQESVTLIDTCDWFETAPGFSQGPTVSGGDYLAPFVEEGKASFIARGMLGTPEDVRKTERYIAQALRYQDEGRPYSLVQVVYPCFYRLLGRPQRPLEAEELDQVRTWFATYVAPSRTMGVLLDRKDDC